MEETSEAISRLTRDLEHAGAGDRAAFQRVYRHTSPKLFGICLSVVRDRAIAEDVLQEVFVKIWHRADRFERGKASPITWLCVIARNSAIDRRRSLDRIPVSSPEMLPFLADEGARVDERLEGAEDRAQIFECLEGLDANQRRSINAAFYDGVTYLELATLWDVPLGTVKSWVRRGLTRLKKCLDEHD